MFMSKLLVLAIVLVALLIGVASAATVINVASKELVIAGGSTPMYYGVITTDTHDVYVTGTYASLPQTLDLFNAIDVSENNSVTESHGVISAVS